PAPPSSRRGGRSRGPCGALVQSAMAPPAAETTSPRAPRLRGRGQRLSMAWRPRWPGRPGLELALADAAARSGVARMPRGLVPCTGARAHLPDALGRGLAAPLERFARSANAIRHLVAHLAVALAHVLLQRPKLLFRPLAQTVQSCTQLRARLLARTRRQQQPGGHTDQRTHQKAADARFTLDYDGRVFVPVGHKAPFYFDAVDRGFVAFAPR